MCEIDTSVTGINDVCGSTHAISKIGSLGEFSDPLFVKPTVRVNDINIYSSN